MTQLVASFVISRQNLTRKVLVSHQLLPLLISSITYPSLHAGERNLYCVSEYGKLKFMKKLEYIPRCMRLYGHDNGALQYMITTTSNTLMIYKDTILKWAAQLSFTPVQVDICSLG